MGDLTRNFSKNEFECPCCGIDWIDRKFVQKLQDVRDQLEIPMIVNSGYRCEQHNLDVGGVPGSYHLKGTAADFHFPNSHFRALAAMHCLNMGLSIGINSGSMLHVDNRAGNNIIFGY